MKVRSPLFFVGDKYKIMPEIKTYFPKIINNYYEPFVGGGSSFLNINAKNFILNDIDPYVIELHKIFIKNANNLNEFLNSLYNIIYKYELSCSYKDILVPNELKKVYIKTYFARYNKEGYLRLREDFNKEKENIKLLYILLIYGFNHMIRFNSKGEFNLPVGNVDFNKNVVNALENYFLFSQENSLNFKNMDYIDFINSIKFKEDDFIYLDPPYLISFSEYNKFWNEDNEHKLYEMLDQLDQKNIAFGVSNLLRHKNKENKILEKWMQKYEVKEINSNYISRFDNTIKKNSLEVYVTNYERKE